MASCFQTRDVRGGTTTGCTPEAPCECGEGDCDDPGDGGRHDGHAGCRGELVCGCGVAEVLCDSDDQCSVRDLVTGWR